MTKEEAIKEIEKAFEPAFANYIITALTEGATVSDIQRRWGRAYEAGVKDGLEQEPCEDAVSRKQVITEIRKWWRTALDAKGSPLICEIIKNLPPVQPKQEPTTKNDLEVDTVSRKAVHDMLENLPITVEDKWFNWLQKACMRLAELPSVIPQKPRWIPVTERLPEESNEYLVSTVWEDVTTDYFRTDSGWMTFEKKEILAWMPLPESYKEVIE